MRNKQRSRVRGVQRLLAAGMLVVLSACSTLSAQRTANDLGMLPAIVTSERFKHQVFFKKGSNLDTSAGKTRLLHVYIEGDGRPWRNRHTVALDPTPKNLLMLKLMATDPAASIYLGRPCYFNLDDPNCTAEWWTDKRYSHAVVASLNQVIQQYADDYDGIMLFGHSGGGTLAMLLAAVRSDVVALVTLAGNLDIDAWARQHRYSYLRGSMNPATQPILNRSIAQYHYLGALDKNITAEMLRPVLRHQHAAPLFLIVAVDHSCCWQQLWPEALQRLPR